MRLIALAVWFAAASHAQVHNVGKDVMDAYEQGMNLRLRREQLDLERERLVIQGARRSTTPKKLDAVKRRALAEDSKAQPFTIDTVMEQADQTSTGVATLTPLQRAALDKWFSEYTLKVMQYVQASDVKKRAPIGSNTAIYTGGSRGHWIKSKTDGGEIVTLEDGSIWQINPVDRIDTMLWLPITDIVILKADSPIGDYSYVLFSKDDREKVLAKYLGNE
jgi:hypothetical protein